MLVVFRYHKEMRTESSEQPPMRTLSLARRKHHSAAVASVATNIITALLTIGSMNLLLERRQLADDHVATVSYHHFIWII